MTSQPPLPPPPWLRGSGKPARQHLSLDAIMSAAKRVLDAEGLGAVTMRRVAQELETGPASLYAYISNKAELDQLLYDDCLAVVPLPEPDPKRWKQQLLDLGLDVSRAMASKPGIARVALETQVPTTPRALLLIDNVFALLRAGGVTDRRALEWSDIYALHLTAAAYELSLRGTAQETTAESRRQASRITEYLDMLSPRQLPHLRAVLPLMSEPDDPEASARAGLTMLLDGL